MFGGDYMSLDQTGVNDNEMTALITDLSDSIDNISKTLDNISSTVLDSNNYLNGDVGSKFRAKFAEFEESFKTIVNNLNSFKTDLINVKNNYIGEDKSIVTNDVTHSKLDEGGNLSGVN